MEEPRKGIKFKYEDEGDKLKYHFMQNCLFRGVMLDFTGEDVAIVNESRYLRNSWPALTLDEHTSKALRACLERRLEWNVRHAQARGILPSDAELASLPAFLKAKTEDDVWRSERARDRREREIKARKAEEEAQKRKEEARQAEKRRRQQLREERREAKREARRREREERLTSEKKHYETLHARWKSSVAAKSSALEEAEAALLSATAKKEELEARLTELAAKKGALLEQLRTTIAVEQEERKKKKRHEGNSNEMAEEPSSKPDLARNEKHVRDEQHRQSRKEREPFQEVRKAPRKDEASRSPSVERKRFDRENVRVRKLSPSRRTRQGDSDRSMSAPRPRDPSERMAMASSLKPLSSRGRGDEDVIPSNRRNRYEAASPRDGESTRAVPASIDGRSHRNLRTSTSSLRYDHRHGEERSSFTRHHHHHHSNEAETYRDGRGYSSPKHRRAEPHPLLENSNDDVRFSRERNRHEEAGNNGDRHHELFESTPRVRDGPRKEHKPSRPRYQGMRSMRSHMKDHSMRLSAEHDASTSIMREDSGRDGERFPSSSRHGAATTAYRYSDDRRRERKRIRR